MDAALNRKSLMFGVPGIILQLVGQFAPAAIGGNPPPDGLVYGGLVVMLLGTVLLIMGLSWYAAAKGHHRAWGLMGFLSLIGLIVLACLPDRKK